MQVMSLVHVTLTKADCLPSDRTFPKRHRAVSLEPEVEIFRDL